MNSRAIFSVVSGSSLVGEPNRIFISEGTFLADEEARGWKRCSEQLDSIRALRKDWDDAGARPIPTAIVDNTGIILEQFRASGFPVPSRVVPSPVGTIVVEWQGSQVHIEVEIAGPYTLEWMLKSGDKPAVHIPETITDEWLLRGESLMAHGRAR